MDDKTHNAHPVRDVIAKLETIMEGDDVALGDLVAAFGSASFAPALMVPALLVVSPLSGIPFFSSICGLTITLIALQMLAARKHLWLPRVLMRRSVGAARLRRAMARIHRVADWLDRHSRDRLLVLVRPPGIALPQALAAFCGAVMPFLEIVPFSSSILGLAVVMFSVSFLARDGLWVIAGCVCIALAALIPVFVVSQFTT